MVPKNNEYKWHFLEIDNLTVFLQVKPFTTKALVLDDDKIIFTGIYKNLKEHEVPFYMIDKLEEEIFDLMTEKG